MPDAPANAFVADPLNPQNVYVATDVGVFFSADYGDNWIPLGAGLPAAPAYDLAIHKNHRQLIVGTHGRSAYRFPLEATTGVAHRDPTNEHHFTSLRQNYPNPFQTTTTIPFLLETDDEISLSVWDLGGRKVSTLFKGYQPAGAHEVIWNGENDDGAQLASGAYVIVLEAGQKRYSKKVMLLK